MNIVLFSASLRDFRPAWFLWPIMLFFSLLVLSFIPAIKEKLYYQNGIITYEYTYHLKTEKILADLKMAGTLVVVGGICYFMPAAAPETVIALGFV